MHQKRQSTWSWLAKRGKSTTILGSFHSTDSLMFFNATSGLDTVGVDALISFLNTLDPNLSAASKEFTSRSNTTIFWPQWQTPSAKGSMSLLTFSDPAGVNVTADNFRTEQIDFLSSLHVSGVTAVGL
ncbi:hypothetical protein DFH08DRAFT_874203 [Mycena albidolilacea]|uniref:Uncharacterized protein n=1 Tax=Mycena albidolilacea TaxID=1033008 RepID=A0AAD6ZVH6_9AGAR|nr:hypothetical protein DFH08DRAFT_874203 [Mycena albidolilacea]